MWKVDMHHHFRIAFQKYFFPITLVLAVLLTIWLIRIGKPEVLPQLWISLIAAILGYWAWVFTGEKLRLDLFDRRFEIYSKTLDYCSVVARYGALELREENKEDITKGLNAAYESFRGIGYHKAQALFGSDIATVFKELNNSYAYISAYGGLRPDGNGYDASKYWDHIKQTVEVSNKLPVLFKPYLYFGDHKQI
jgi:hypothetical protein